MRYATRRKDRDGDGSVGGEHLRLTGAADVGGAGIAATGLRHTPVHNKN